MVDPLSSSPTTSSASQSGPSLTASIQSYSGNSVTAASGMYLEDYYFDNTCASNGGVFLDENNGHDHDNYGYHYHVTSSFPYTAGPKFKGCLKSSTCCGSQSAAFTGTGCSAVPSCSPLSSPTTAPITPATSSYSCNIPTPMPTPFPTLVPTIGPTNFQVDYGCLHVSSWVLDGGKSSLFNSTMMDVHLSTITNKLSTIASNWSVTFYGIPNYLKVLTSQDVSLLNNRPKKATDFVIGKPSVVRFDKIQFGGNVGYIGSSCGLGYFPPTVSCPVPKQTTVIFPLNPNVEGSTGGCFTASGSPIGYWVNGVAIYSPSSGHSYQNSDVWHYVNPVFDQYDVDICLGSVDSTSGQYYQRTYSSCLMNRLGEVLGSDHSPIYGWMNDGIPVYGPYNGPSILAQSCWVKASYSSGTRVDGPSISSTVLSDSGNSISAASGLFFEDYSFDSSCYNILDTDSPNLDYHNGHSHGDYGYHYHTTVDSSLKPTFPFVVGPKYKACLKNSPSRCCNTQTLAFRNVCR